jgi:hypothetical protein
VLTSWFTSVLGVVQASHVGRRVSFVTAFKRSVIMKPCTRGYSARLEIRLLVTSLFCRRVTDGTDVQKEMFV